MLHGRRPRYTLQADVAAVDVVVGCTSNTAAHEGRGAVRDGEREKVKATVIHSPTMELSTESMLSIYVSRTIRSGAAPSLNSEDVVVVVVVGRASIRRMA